MEFTSKSNLNNEIALWITTILLTTLFLITVIYNTLIKKWRISVKYPPGPRGFSVLGFLPSFLDHNPHEVLDNLVKQYGDIFTIKVAGRSYIVLNSYEAIREAYINDAENFSHRPTNFSLFGELFKFKALAFINGEEWKIQRQVLGSCFKVTVKNKLTLENAATNVTQRLVNQLQALNGEPTDIYNLLAISSIEFMSTLISGKSLEPKDARLLLTDMRELFALAPGWRGFLDGGLMNFIVYNRFSKTRRKMAKIQNRQFEFFNGIIQEHELNLDPKNPKNYIDAFLMERETATDNTKSWFDFKNLAANMLMIYTGGTDTVSSALYFCTYLMAKYPDIQTRCQEELGFVVGDSAISWPDQNRLPYIEAVINEVLRYAGIASLPQPRNNSASATIKTFHIPANTTFITNLWTATQDPKYFSNPGNFDPNNFFEKSLPRGISSLPFSAGKRICPGESAARLEIFTIFTAILQRFALSFPETELPSESLLSGFNRALVPFKIIAMPR